MLRTLTRRLAESISARAAYPPRGTGTGKTRVPTPNSGTLDDYLRFYAETDEYRLELLLALARKDADALADEACLALLDHFLTQLEAAVANRLDALDHAVARLIEANPKGYLEHPRSSSKLPAESQKSQPPRTEALCLAL